MPTVFELFGLRFFFFSDEHLPRHIHVASNDGRAKIVLEPSIELEYNRGLKTQDLKRALKLVKMYQKDIIETWNKYFD